MTCQVIDEGKFSKGRGCIEETRGAFTGKKVWQVLMFEQGWKKEGARSVQTSQEKEKGTRLASKNSLGMSPKQHVKLENSKEGESQRRLCGRNLIPFIQCLSGGQFCPLGGDSTPAFPVYVMAAKSWAHRDRL